MVACKPCSKDIAAGRAGRDSAQVGKPCPASQVLAHHCAVACPPSKQVVGGRQPEHSYEVSITCPSSAKSQLPIVYR